MNPDQHAKQEPDPVCWSTRRASFVVNRMTRERWELDEAPLGGLGAVMLHSRLTYGGPRTKVKFGDLHYWKPSGKVADWDGRWTVQDCEEFAVAALRILDRDEKMPGDLRLWLFRELTEMARFVKEV